MQIDTIDELKALLKASGLKVEDVDDLQGVLAAVNATYNPDAARVRVAKMIGVQVPCFLAGAVGLVSFMLVVFSDGLSKGAAYPMTALAVMWGACAAVSIVAVCVSVGFLVSRRGRQPEADQAAPPAPVRAPVLPAGERPTGVVLPEHRSAV
jgi:hypothetical protein